MPQGDEMNCVLSIANRYNLINKYIFIILLVYDYCRIL